MIAPYFVSYSSVDGLQLATQLAGALARPPHALAVWLDKQSLRPGEDWDEQIAEAIRLTPALLFVVTEDSVSPRSVCKSEWAFALTNAKPVIPLRFHRRADMPLRLVSSEYIDFADSFGSGVERLRSFLIWTQTPEGQRREIHRQLADAERKLARAAESDQAVIRARIAALRAELDAGPAPALSTPDPLDETPDAAMRSSPVAPPHHPPWTPPRDRRDPIAVLEEQAAGWESELTPVRYGRMLHSPFDFYRGAAAVMAADLASTPSSGIAVQACGDAALTSFGFVAGAPTELVFDIISFDHTLPGPFEWDVKRLATSVAVAALDDGCSRDTATRVARETVKAYRKSMARFAKLSPFDVLPQPIDTADRVLPHDAPKERARLARRFDELVIHDGDGTPRLVDRPPLISHVDAPAFASEVRDAYDGYLKSLPDQASAFLQRYELADHARLVIGVERAARGDVLMLLVGREDGEPLLLDLVRPGSSVLEPYVGANPYSTDAERVVRGQRLLQAAADAYLGWAATADGGSRYVRRHRPLLIVERARRGKQGKFLATYGRACATALARGRGRSGDAAAITDHLGDGPAFDDAIARFARHYAMQTHSDYEAFRSACEAGRIG